MKLGFGLVVFGLFLLYALVLLAGAIYFRAGKDGPFKSLWYPRYVIFMACVFFFFFFLPLPDNVLPTMPGQQAPKQEAGGFDRDEIAFALLFLPLVAFKSWRTIRNTRFCPNCGTMQRKKGFSKVKFCRRCGTELPDSKASAL